MVAGVPATAKTVQGMVAEVPAIAKTVQGMVAEVPATARTVRWMVAARIANGVPKGKHGATKTGNNIFCFVRFNDVCKNYSWRKQRTAIR
jgi:hypothetical protein